MAAARVAKGLEEKPNQTRAPTHIEVGKNMGHASVVDYEDEYVRLNSQMQLVWENVMEEVPYKSSSSYKNVAVLLLSWDKDLDDMQVEEEVSVVIYLCLGCSLSFPSYIGQSPRACFFGHLQIQRSQ